MATKRYYYPTCNICDSCEHNWVEEKISFSILRDELSDSVLSHIREFSECLVYQNRPATVEERKKPNFERYCTLITLPLVEYNIVFSFPTDHEGPYTGCRCIECRKTEMY